MSYVKKIRPKRFFFVANNKDQKRHEMGRLGQYLNGFPASRFCKITVTEGKEARSEEQNALWWVWNHELARAHDDSEDKDYYHAYNKLYVLLPLMLHTWDRWREEAEFIAAAISAQTSERARLRVAYRCLESSELHVKEGKLYTEKIQQHWEELGVKLEIQASTKRYLNYPEVQQA